MNQHVGEVAARGPTAAVASTAVTASTTTTATTHTLHSTRHRLPLTGVPLRESSAHCSPGSSLESTTDALSGHAAVALRVGEHVFQLQWKKVGFTRSSTQRRVRGILFERRPWRHSITNNININPNPQP